MKCYKITSYNYSAFAYGHASVEYNFNSENTAPEWLAEQGYYLTAFNSLKNAKAFMKKYSLPYSARLWLCDGYEKVDLPPYASLQYLANGKIVTEIDGGWPKGTVMFEKIVFKKRIA